MIIYLLGNPGKNYEQTRHNVARRLLPDLPLPQGGWEKKFKGQYKSFFHNQKKHYLLISGDFMNLSGEALGKMTAFFKLSPQDVLVVHDDLELPLGEWKLQKGGGLGGHKGLKSIKQHLGTGDFHRLRIGIGRPSHGSVSSFVLGKFTQEEMISLEQIQGALKEALLSKLG